MSIRRRIYANKTYSRGDEWSANRMAHELRVPLDDLEPELKNMVEEGKLSDVGRDAGNNKLYRRIGVPPLAGISWRIRSNAEIGIDDREAALLRR